MHLYGVFAYLISLTHTHRDGYHCFWDLARNKVSYQPGHSRTAGTEVIRTYYSVQIGVWLLYLFSRLLGFQSMGRDSSLSQPRYVYRTR
ncbi:hypothetical protein V8F06_012065 [Rhypophila decipiens]